MPNLKTKASLPRRLYEALKALQPAFEYLNPESVKEACAALDEFEGKKDGRLPPLELNEPVYVIDAEESKILGEFQRPTTEKGTIPEAIHDAANSIARNTGHTVVVAQVLAYY